MLVLFFVALWFILRSDLLYVFPALCHFVLVFSVLLVLRLPRLGKRELILVLFVRLFDLCLFGFVGFLFLLGSGKGCGLWLWHSLDFSLTFFVYCLSMICSLFYKMSLVGFDLLFWLILDIFSLLFYGYRTLTFISRSSKITKQIYKEILNVQISTKAESKAGSDWWRYQQCLHMYNKTWYQSTQHKLKLAVLQTRQDKSLVNNYRITAPGLVYTICSGLSVRKLYVLRVLS